MSSWAALHVREHRRGSNRNPLPTSALHRICCHSTEYRGCHSLALLFIAAVGTVKNSTSQSKAAVSSRIPGGYGYRCFVSDKGDTQPGFVRSLKLAIARASRTQGAILFFVFSSWAPKICPLSVTDSMCCNSLCPESSSGF